MSFRLSRQRYRGKIGTLSPALLQTTELSGFTLIPLLLSGLRLLSTPRYSFSMLILPLFLRTQVAHLIYSICSQYG